MKKNLITGDKMISNKMEKIYLFHFILIMRKRISVYGSAKKTRRAEDSRYLLFGFIPVYSTLKFREEL